MAKPSLLGMDEPTSGLDSTAACDILEALKRMANLGMNIVTVRVVGRGGGTLGVCALVKNWTALSHGLVLALHIILYL